MTWPGWPFRIAVSFDFTFGPVKVEDEVPVVDQKETTHIDTSFHEGSPVLGLTPRRP